MDTTAYENSCTVVGCTLASGSFSQVSFNYKEKDFSKTKVFIADSTLVSYKASGTTNFSKQTNTIPGTVTLGDNVTLYTYASGYASTGVTVNGKALTKETDATVSAAGKTFTGMNKWQTATEAAVLDMNTGIGYESLSAAMSAQNGEGALKLLQDITATNVTIRTGVTLDLNGKTLQTKYFTCYGSVIDGSAGGEALVKAEKRIHVAGQDSYLPIYDTAAGGYRFYAYELNNLGSKNVVDNPNAVKFGFRLTLANAEGYSVLASTEDPGLDVFAYLSWGDMPAPLSYQFKDSTLKSYAALVAGGSTTSAIVLTVTGTDVLESGTQLQVEYGIASAPGVTAHSASCTWPNP